MQNSLAIPYTTWSVLAALNISPYAAFPCFGCGLADELETYLPHYPRDRTAKFITFEV